MKLPASRSALLCGLLQARKMHSSSWAGQHGYASSWQLRLSAIGSKSSQALARRSSAVSSADELACHACGRVHDGARSVTLPDGTSVGSYSEAYRAYTEAKWVFDKLPVTVNTRRKKTPQISRREYILAVQAKRGQVAANELANIVTKLWKASK